MTETATNFISFYDFLNYSICKILEPLQLKGPFLGHKHKLACNGSSRTGPWAKDRGFRGWSCLFYLVATFTAGTILDYQPDLPQDVRVVVYDALRRQVAVLYSGSQSAGAHRLKWSPAVSGVYFVLLKTSRQ